MKESTNKFLDFFQIFINKMIVIMVRNVKKQKKTAP